MKIHLPQYDCHLSYCMNVHPGNSWQEHFAAIKTCVPKIRKQLLAKEESFGLGMRLSAQAAKTLLEQAQEIETLHEFFRAENLYPFTINVFPYGEFHQGGIKKKVYLPDWASPERLQYTLQVARILAKILPPGLDYGTLSSMPIGYRDALNAKQFPQILDNLNELILQLQKLEQDTGRLIKVGLEPEPDCLLDSTASICRFFCEQFRRHCKLPIEVQNRYLGICLDTCHLAVLYESPAECLQKLRQNQIPVVKIHLSAAPVFSAKQLPAAKAFVDPVYLHQSTVKILPEDATIRRFADLPDALTFAKAQPACELRTHFHIPLACPDSTELRSTFSELGSDFVRELQLSAVRHLEVETYTFAVLPPHLRQQPLEVSIAQDLACARNFFFNHEKHELARKKIMESVTYESSTSFP